MSRGKKAKRRDELLDHPRLKQREIKEYRDLLYDTQLRLCPLCGCPIPASEQVLDHDHGSGFLRGTLHRGCNALLGKCENNYKRMGVSWEQLCSISPNIGEYLSRDYSHLPYHPSHRTAEEKRLSRNERAKEARVKKKSARRKMPRG